MEEPGQPLLCGWEEAGEVDWPVGVEMPEGRAASREQVPVDSRAARGKVGPVGPRGRSVCGAGRVGLGGAEGEDLEQDLRFVPVPRGRARPEVTGWGLGRWPCTGQLQWDPEMGSVPAPLCLAPWMSHPRSALGVWMRS